ncbi:GIY-YIG nuclease family protein [Roseateles sp. DB2]|uniref:GIY-YIG nuclease family protein n=1 Tax=Roseateles sp. DB2 TaxID=3453717 RepID=UPI003EEC1FB3
MEDSVTFEELPEDHFGVLVQNEMDERRLLWLVNQIGEGKVRASAAKRNKHYPESKLFVSVLLKRFHLKVPVHVYAPVRVKIYAVYVLCLRDDSAMKVGFTSNWPSRAWDYVKPRSELDELFEIDKSVAIHFDSKDQAMRAEGLVKERFASYRVESPYHRRLIPYGCFGHTEWFNTSQYDDVLDLLAAERAPAASRVVSLREAIYRAGQFDDAALVSGQALM